MKQFTSLKNQAKQLGTAQEDAKTHATGLGRAPATLGASNRPRLNFSGNLSRSINLCPPQLKFSLSIQPTAFTSTKISRWPQRLIGCGATVFTSDFVHSSSRKVGSFGKCIPYLFVFYPGLP
jgi:hypothetical protein